METHKYLSYIWVKDVILNFKSKWQQILEAADFCF